MEADPGRARLFVAAMLPPAVTDVIASLPRADGPGVRWTRPEQWHVTLRFLGQSSIADAGAALERVDHPVARAELAGELSRLGRGVICVRVGGLETLAAAVNEALADVGEPPEHRDFVGHVTLARVSDARFTKRKPPLLTATRVPGRAWTVRDVSLVRSDVDQDGARYQTIERVDLRG